MIILNYLGLIFISISNDGVVVMKYKLLKSLIKGEEVIYLLLYM